MKAEIVSIGTELITGQNLDTNCQWLSKQLAALGVPVHFHTTLQDDLAENVAALLIAKSRADLVILTGGLGPTQDDLTREALAAVAGVALVHDEPTWEHIQNLFRNRGRVCPERNKVQALFPAGATIIPNRMGTAPGIWLPVGGTVFAAMPGVPSEMFVMFTEQVKPRLGPYAGAGVLIERKINCFGAGESAVEAKLLDLTRRGHVPEVGITVSDATISLRILAKAPDAAAAEALIAPVEKTIRERLGDWVFGVGTEELQHAVAALLKARNLTLATAESVTGGLVAQRLTEVPGISSHFRGGVVAYTDAVKAAVLGVPQELLDRHGAVSKEVAEAMAVGCRDRLGAAVAVSTTGLAGPDGDGSGKPVGLVYAGLAWAGGVRSQELQWPGTREEIRSRTAKMALNLVRLHLRAGG